MKRNFLILVFNVVLLNPIFSQPFVDIVSIRYQYFPGVEYVSENRKMTINEFTYSLTLPLELKNKNVVIVGGSFDDLQFSSSNAEVKKYLYGLTLQLGYLHYWKGTKWKTLFMALPKISSDRILLTKSTYQQAGAVLFTYQKKENLAYKFGLYYSPEFFGNFFMPLVGLEWKPTPKINIYGMIPASGTVEYKLNSNLYTGVAYINLTQSYRIYGTQTFIRNGDKFLGNIQLKAFLNCYLKKYLVVFAEAGYTLWRRYEAYDNSQELAFDPVYSKTRNGALINLGIAFRVRTDQNILSQRTQNQ